MPPRKNAISGSRGLQLHRLFAVGDGLAVLPSEREDMAEIGVRGRRIRIEIDRPAKG